MEKIHSTSSLTTFVIFLSAFPLSQLNSLQLQCPSCSNLNCFPTFSWLWLRLWLLAAVFSARIFTCMEFEIMWGSWLAEGWAPEVLGHVSGLTLSLAGAGQFNHLLSFTALVTCPAASSNIAKNNRGKLQQL